MAKEWGATVRVRPVDYGQIFPISGGLPLPKRAPQRQAYRLVELKRFSEHLGLPLNLQPKFFPVAGDPAARLIIAVDQHDGADAALRFCGAVFRAVWVEERDIADAGTLAQLLQEAGLNANLWSTRSTRACRRATSNTPARRSTPTCSARPATWSTAKFSGARTGSTFCSASWPPEAAASRHHPHSFKEILHGQFRQPHGRRRHHLSGLRGHTRPASRAAAWWCCRRSSASTRTSARWPTAMPPTGYLAVAPATFHRVKPGVELGYTQDDMNAGFGLKTAVEALPAPGVMPDIQAAIDHAAQAGKVGIVGYCWGGLLTWRSACAVNGLAAAVPYYGGGMTAPADARASPRCR